MPEVSPRVFSTEFKVGLLPRLQAGVSVAALSRELRDRATIDLRLAEVLSGLWDSRAQPEARAAIGLAISAIPREPISEEEDTSAAGKGDALVRAKIRIAELKRLIGRRQADLHFFLSIGLQILQAE